MVEPHYDLVVHSDALEDLRRAYTFVRRHAPQTVDRWFERLFVSTKTLESNPQRCPIARESARVAIEIREFHFGRRPNLFRILFTIDDNKVRILKIVRAQRRSPSWRSIEASYWNE